MTPEPRLAIALDVPDADEARRLVELLRPVAGVFKIGLELLFAGGMPLARELVATGAKIFLDAKLLDIDATVERATARIAALGVSCLTVHAHDARVVAAALHGRGGSPMRVLGVTVLTSLSDADIAAQGFGMTVKELVMRRTAIARDGGLDGIIASAREVATVRAMWPDALIATPGIRIAGSATDDQARTATPAEAIAAGADLLVVGRPITRAADPLAATRAICAVLPANQPAARTL